jgi:TIR domain
VNRQQPSNTTSRDLFLSHRSVNKTIVRDLAGEIEAESFQGRGLLTWLDEAEIRPGQSIPAMVNTGLECSRFIGLVMTPDYFDPSATGWTDAEWHSALHQDPDNRRPRIIPLLVQDCPYIPMLLRHLATIDLRADHYERGFRQLLAVLRDEPLPRPVSHRGQLITSGSKIARSSLIAERAVPQADPDVTTERLYCNLLPVERPPQYVYSASIASDLMRQKKDGSLAMPSKADIKEAIRQHREKEGNPDLYMPAFRLFEDRLFTFHDLESPECPLSPIVEEGDIETLDIPTFAQDEELRKVLLSLLNMSLARHMVHAGLVADDSKHGRFFFPSKDGGESVITWTPRKKKASRRVAKPVVKDGKTLFWRHLGAYLQIIFLVGRFYLKITPTWVITDDGRTPSGGPDIGKRVSKWTNPERNLQVLFHVRFWTSVLRNRRAGLISIWAGDQSIEIATVPALIQQSYGIEGDQKDLLRLLDEEAPLIAAEEEENADNATAEGLTGEPADDDIEPEEFEGDIEAPDAE